MRLGMSGRVIYDENADRDPDFWITDMASNGTFVKIAELVNLDPNTRVSSSKDSVVAKLAIAGPAYWIILVSCKTFFNFSTVFSFIVHCRRPVDSVIHSYILVYLTSSKSAYCLPATCHVIAIACLDNTYFSNECSDSLHTENTYTSVCSFQNCTLFIIQIYSSSTYQHPLWFKLFFCACSHSPKLTTSQRSFLWTFNNLPGTP